MFVSTDLEKVKRPALGDRTMVITRKKEECVSAKQFVQQGVLMFKPLTKSKKGRCAAGEPIVYRSSV